MGHEESESPQCCGSDAEESKKGLKVTKFIWGLIFVALCVALVATVHVYRGRIQAITNEYGLKVKDRALKVKDYADDLEKLANAMTGSPAAETYGLQVRKIGKGLEEYANTLIRQIQGPESAMEIKEFGLLMPKLSKTISEQATNIKKLQLLNLKYRSRLDTTELQLNICQATGGVGIDKGESLRLVREAQQKYRGQIDKLEEELHSCNDKSRAD